MCTLLFPNDEIIKIKYFTAPIEEKGTDVNIASHLINDAHNNLKEFTCLDILRLDSTTLTNFYQSDITP
mgnify:CR=1 FL=1